ncbi:hypothetical protein OSCI_1700001 [Kamptonema sp. PCC 6506]|nr:hypothetical protein OSCI_1700001 [Kamptonema sp. PCC 6506]
MISFNELALTLNSLPSNDFRLYVSRLPQGSQIMEIGQFKFATKSKILAYKIDYYES